jgi:16S rRNA (cytidine1402-2'-O)-methyltransferase
MGDRYGVMAREMTKLHEEFIRDQLSEILAALKGRSAIKGECTLLVSGWNDNRAVEWESVQNEIKDQLQSSTEPISKVVKKISQKYGLPKNKVYQEALVIRRPRTGN